MSDEHDNLTFKTRLVMRRNAVLGSLRFQHWASRTPGFRWISRRYATAQFDLVAGFVYSQVLAAFVEFGLLEYLNGHVRSDTDICSFAKLSEAATMRLLKAAESLDLAESPQTGLWTLGKAGAPLSANAGAIAMIRHHHLLYRDLADPSKLLADDRTRETALSAYWTYASREFGEAGVTGYSALMAATQPMVSQQIIDAYPFGKHRRMLDIGGGSGAFANAVAASAPVMELGIFDLPDVIAEAEKRLESGKFAKRISFYPGSFKETPLPEGYELITLVRILHDHDDDVSQALLTNIHQALPPGGKLLIIEPMADNPHARRMGDAYFGMYLWAMGSGQPRSAATISDMLHNAGFSAVKSVRTAMPIITSALVASK
jgi:demethylspheroidene O-methyltransferase